MKETLLSGDRAVLPAGVHQPPGRRDRLPGADPRRPGADRRVRAAQGSPAAGRAGDCASSCEETAKEFLIDKGYNPDFGARPLRRAIEQNVEDPLSEEILRGDFKAGQLIKISHEEDKDELTFTPTDAAAEKKEPAKLAKSSAETT